MERGVGSAGGGAFPRRALAVAVGVAFCAGATLASTQGSPQGARTAARPAARLAAALNRPGPMILARHPSHTSHTGTTSIGLFTATPARLPASGGKVHLLAVVQGATSCSFSSAKTVAHLPSTEPCSSGSVSIDVKLPRNTSASARTYRFDLTATGSHSSAKSAPVMVVQGAPGHVPPQITLEPAVSPVDAGANVTLTAAARGVPRPSVHWQLSTDGGGTWANIPGATSTAYAFSALASENGYRYRAVFRNATGVAFTAPVTLSVSAASPPALSSQPQASPPASQASPGGVTPADAAPAITTQPTSQDANPGTDVTFTAAASGNPAPSVQWQYSLDGGTTWTALPGATSPAVELVTPSSGTVEELRATFTNSLGTATTTPVELTASTEDLAPQITQQPTNQTATVGATVSFSASAEGIPAPTVQWQVSPDGVNWSDISGATSSPLTFLASQGLAGYEYRAVFTNFANGEQSTATTNAAQLTVDTIPTITIQPAGVSVQAGTTASFTSTASGTPAPTVQWWDSTDGGHSWNAVSGATSTTYSFTAQAGDSGNEYEAVFTNAVGSTTSNAASLSVLAGTPPQITQQPTEQSVVDGGTATFTAAATGTAPISVQWEVSTDSGQHWGNVSGATSATYQLTAASSENGYEYRALFSNGAGSQTTSAAPLAVCDVSASSSTNWSGYVACGAIFTTVSASWTVPAVTCPSGATNASIWVGIDGDTSNTVEQDGTDSDCQANGQPRYFAWYEMYGDSAVNGGSSVDLSSAWPVAPGDQITASASYGGGAWTLQIYDPTENWTYTTSPAIPSPSPAPLQSSAEWIVERPEICSPGCSLSTLSKFGSVTFTNAGASSTTGSGSISAFPNFPITMLGNSNATDATVGSLGSGGASFTDTWQSSN